jgi:serine/threonine protein kinase
MLLSVVNDQFRSEPTPFFLEFVADQRYRPRDDQSDGLWLCTSRPHSRISDKPSRDSHVCRAGGKLLCLLGCDCYDDAISSCILSFVLQVLKNIPHDQRVDLWSVGVVIFVLLVGYPPFLDENQNKLFQKIRNGEWEFVEEDWKQISNDAKDLIKGLLVVDPADRCSISDCLRSAWIHEDESNLATDLTDSLLTLRTKKSRLRSMARVFKGVGDKTEATEVATQAQVPVLELFKPPTPEGSDNLAIV